MRESIPVKREPRCFGVDYEECCGCPRYTPFWTDLSDREDGEQVPMCRTCARKCGRVPTNDEYFSAADQMELLLIDIPEIALADDHPPPPMIRWGSDMYI